MTGSCAMSLVSSLPKDYIVATFSPSSVVFGVLGCCVSTVVGFSAVAIFGWRLPRVCKEVTGGGADSLMSSVCTCGGGGRGRRDAQSFWGWKTDWFQRNSSRCALKLLFTL